MHKTTGGFQAPFFMCCVLALGERMERGGLSDVHELFRGQVAAGAWCSRHGMGSDACIRCGPGNPSSSALARISTSACRSGSEMAGAQLVIQTLVAASLGVSVMPSSFDAFWQFVQPFVAAILFSAALHTDPAVPLDEAQVRRVFPGGSNVDGAGAVPCAVHTVAEHSSS